VAIVNRVKLRVATLLARMHDGFAAGWEAKHGPRRIPRQSLGKTETRGGENEPGEPSDTPFK